MVKATCWGGVTLGLALLLAACSGMAVEGPAEPTVVEPAAVTAGEKPQATTPASVEPASPDEAGVEAKAAVQSGQGQEEAAKVVEQAEVDKMEDSSEEMATTVAEPVAEVAPEQAEPTEAQRQLLSNLAVKGTPPELHNEVWLNSAPLKLADLRGKVAIVEFWTFG